jgi:hypothetical protein
MTTSSTFPWMTLRCVSCAREGRGGDGRDDVLELVRLDDRARLLRDRRGVDGIHLARARARGEEGQDARPAADVEDDRAAEDGRAAQDEAAVRRRAHAVLQHDLVDLGLAVRLEVVAVVVARRRGGGLVRVRAGREALGDEGAHRGELRGRLCEFSL